MTLNCLDFSIPENCPSRCSYRELSLGVVPVEVDRASHSLLIVVIRAFIFIQGEVSVRAGVDADLQVCGRLLTGVLLDRTDWNDAPSSDKQRYLLKRSGDVGNP